MSIASEPSTVTPNSVIPDVPTLNTADRCDSCGAQARVRATLADSGLHLMFCAHHAREHIDALLPQTSEWLDETRFLEQE